MKRYLFEDAAGTTYQLMAWTWRDAVEAAGPDALNLRLDPAELQALAPWR